MIKLTNAQIAILDSLVVSERVALYQGIEQHASQEGQETMHRAYAPYLRELNAIHEQCVAEGGEHDESDATSKRRGNKRQKRG